MKMIVRIVMLQAGCLVLQAACLAQTPAPAWTQAAPDPAAAAAPRTLAPYFAPAGPQAAAPDADGFIRRWILLEPIVKPNWTNTVFTGSYVREALNTQYFPDRETPPARTWTTWASRC
jgi:hypothetical protein